MRTIVPESQKCPISSPRNVRTKLDGAERLAITSEALIWVPQTPTLGVAVWSWVVQP